mmetsp:Transcript_10825/g.44886  ORF Transcript_10825/g.44886 Transcript_10825/m.44886 type:complete len:225 (-) Transcript_10825:621-1295(-)
MNRDGMKSPCKSSQNPVTVPTLDTVHVDRLSQNSTASSGSNVALLESRLRLTNCEKNTQSRARSMSAATETYKALQVRRRESSSAINLDAVGGVAFGPLASLIACSMESSTEVSSFVSSARAVFGNTFARSHACLSLSSRSFDARRADSLFSVARSMMPATTSASSHWALISLCKLFFVLCASVSPESGHLSSFFNLIHHLASTLGLTPSPSFKNADSASSSRS